MGGYNGLELPVVLLYRSGALKNVIDRQLPMLLPFMEEKEGQIGSGGHPSRYDMSGKRRW